jgi:glycosyltransferase involved in cell wall biosynthesis
MRATGHPAGGQRAPLGRIAIFVPTLAGGGAEHVVLTLAAGFLRNGYAVDLVLVKAAGALMSRVPPGVHVVELGTSRVIWSVPALRRYLRRQRPLALLSTLDTANVVAVVAARLAGCSTRVVIRQATHLSRTLERGPKTFVSVLKLMLPCSYAYADAVIAVSGGVADDLAERLRLPRSRIHVVPNPIVTSELHDLASRSVDHEWFAPGSLPVVLGVGRLTPLKGFDVLIKAFAAVRTRCEARLMILGDGEERPNLLTLIHALGLQAFVSLHGFVDNPLAYIARAKVFVLSSASEGLPGVLIQALACGTPVVATDCDSGPREILQDGRYGHLVPVGDTGALAGAICEALEKPHAAPVAEAWCRYTEPDATKHYLRILVEAVDG